MKDIGDTSADDLYGLSGLLKAACGAIAAADGSKEQVSPKEKMSQYQPLIEPRSLGFFLADFLSDKQRLADIKDEVVFSYKVGNEHPLKGMSKDHVRACGQRYMLVHQAFKALDLAVKAYFSKMLEQFNQAAPGFGFDPIIIDDHSYGGIVMTHIDATMPQRVRSLKTVTDRNLAFSTELSAFYMVALETLGAAQDILNPEFHHKALNKILKSEPLLSTFLASKHNGHSGCPFYAINQLLSADMHVMDDGSISMNEKNVPGALLPFVMQRVAEAKGIEPVIPNASVKLVDTTFNEGDFWACDGI